MILNEKDLPADIRALLEQYRPKHHARQGRPVVTLFAPDADKEKVVNALKEMAKQCYRPLSERMKVYNEAMGKARFWAFVYIAFAARGDFNRGNNINHYSELLDENIEAEALVTREKINDNIPKNEEFETYLKINKVRAIEEIENITNPMRKKLRQYLLVKTMLDSAMK